MDLQISNWVATHLHCTFLDWLMPLVTRLGDSGFIWIIFCIVLLARKKTRRYGVICGLSLLLAFVSGELIVKNIVQRARPFTHLKDFELLIPAPNSFSFPSGHSASSFAGALPIFFMNRKLGMWAILLAALIAFSRIYLTVHYVTDVAVGILLGVFCACLVNWAVNKYWPTKAE